VRNVRNVRRKTGEHRLDEALKATASALGAARCPWMVIGGILYRFDDDRVYAMTTRGQPPLPVDE